MESLVTFIHTIGQKWQRRRPGPFFVLIILNFKDDNNYIANSNCAHQSILRIQECTVLGLSVT